ncbi:ATP-binding protein [Streptomyces sp. IBSBF 2435]|uniref:ATP-binding protein n=1 Tax=Streptomyces sp. IBSBF 2435 TaxID=2903531 RepID=UPI002FDBD793
MRTSEVYGRESGTIARARMCMAAFLDGVRARTGVSIPQHVTDAAQLVVSELVTNAAKHTSGPYGLDLEFAGHGVEITVWDSSPEPLVAMSPDPQRIGRHGLEIVSALTEAVSSTATDRGKSVTVLLRLPVADPA